MTRVLLVEDEPGLVLTLTDRLESEGYRVGSASDGPSGLERAVHETWDVILLDVMLPGMNGFDVCRDLRQKGVRTPVIMLTARGQVFDKVLGLKLGADDYLTKPFEMMELLARIEVQLRRAASPAAGSAVYRFGDVVVDVRRAEVTRAGRVVDLSAREFLLLKYLVEHQGAVITPRPAAERGVGVSLDAVDAHRRRARGLAAAEDRAGARAIRNSSSPSTASATSSRIERPSTSIFSFGSRRADGDRRLAASRAGRLDSVVLIAASRQPPAASRDPRALDGMDRIEPYFAPAHPGIRNAPIRLE